jgi:hypothetical protein
MARTNTRKITVNHYRTGWISDVDLGTKGSNAEALLDFLRENEFETLYIVGDLIDIWSLRRGIYWPQEHNDVIQKILRKARKGTGLVISRAITMSFSSVISALTARSRSRSMPFIARQMVAASWLFMVMSWTPWCKTPGGSRSRATLVISSFSRSIRWFILSDAALGLATGR